MRWGLRRVSLLELAVFISVVVGNLYYTQYRAQAYFIPTSEFSSHTSLTSDGEQEPEVSTPQPKPVGLSIAQVGVNIPVESKQLSNGQWYLSDTQAVHLASSASPGEGGNIIVYGHNTQGVLGDVKDIREGDVIALQTEDGKQYEYRVTTLEQVDPDQIEAILPTTYEVLTMYTCSGFLDSQRLIVRALPIGVSSALSGV